MRKSLGGSGGSGGGVSGGDMLRSVGRVVRTKFNNFQDPPPPCNNNNNNTQKTLSSAKTQNTTSNHYLTLSSPNTNSTLVSDAWPPSPNYSVSSSSQSDKGVDHEAEGDDHNKWECFENYYDPVFGVVPSTHEVHHALFSLEQVLDPRSRSVSSTEEKPCEVDNTMDEHAKSDARSTLPTPSSKGSDSSDWVDPSMYPFDWKVTQSPGWGTVHDAFRLLQNEPTVQRMVVSLSSDKAVWDAVLRNEAVREIRDSYRDAAESFPPSSDEQIDPSKADSSLLKWIFENMKMKLVEVLGSISQIVCDTFKPLDCDKEEQSSAFTEKLKSTFLLTIVVLLVVVVARGHMA